MLTVVLLNGEVNDDSGALHATARSRADMAAEVWRSADARAPGRAFLAAGSGRGEHFNKTDTNHFEYLKAHLLARGLSEAAWVGGWPSEHTVHDALLAFPLLEDWLAAQSPESKEDCGGVCDVVVVTSTTHMPRVKHLYTTYFNAANANGITTRHPDAARLGVSQRVSSPISVWVQWEGQEEALPSNTCRDWTLRVQWRDTPDPVSPEELQQRIQREEMSIAGLKEAPFGCWREWLEQNVHKQQQRMCCIIPARGGSKRLPRKNIRDFVGQPMLCYPVRAAVQSNMFDLVMVSTDDQEIADIAIEAGAEVPFLRSASTSGDHATLAHVVAEVLEGLKAKGEEFDIFCVLLATNPFTYPEVLKSAGELLMASPVADSVMPVIEFNYPIQRSLKKVEKNGIEYLAMVWPEYVETRTQDCEFRCHDCGHFYFMKVRYFLEKRPKWLIGEHTLPMMMPASEVQDIDSAEDWKRAELKYLHIHGSGPR